MGFKIQVRRGVEKDLPMLDNGELGFAEDTSRLYVGSEVGNERIANHKELVDYVNYTYRDLNSIIKDVAYLKLISDTGGRIEDGTTFGTNFTRTYNITMNDAFAIMESPVTPSATEVYLEMAGAEVFNAGETVSVYDADNLEECEVVSVSASHISLNKLEHTYPGGFQIARSMTDNGMFDKKRYTINTPEGDFENAFAGNALTAPAQGAIRRNAVTRSGIIVVGNAQGNVIEVRALDMRKSEPQWYTAGYINAPAGHIMRQPSITFDAFNDEDGVVIVFWSPTSRDVRLVRMKVDRYYGTDYYASSLVVPQESPLRSVQSYDVVPDLNDEDKVTPSKSYYISMSARTDRRPNTNNIYGAVINVKTDNTLSSVPFAPHTQASDVTDSATHISTIPRGYGNSFVNGKMFTKGAFMTVFMEPSTNTIQLAHAASIGYTTKIISGEENMKRTYPASTYVRRKDWTDPIDHGEVHVAWLESTPASNVGKVMHTVSYDLGKTFSVPVAIAHDVYMGVAITLTVGADGMPVVSYVHQQTIISQTEEDKLAYHLYYKFVGSVASGITQNDVSADTYISTAYNPYLNLESPLTVYFDKTTNFLKVRGQFTQDITRKHKVNHMRFRINKTGLEIAMWVVKSGDIDVQAHVKGVPFAKFAGSDEDEFTHVASGVQEFDVTLVLTRTEIAQNDVRGITSISGGVS